MKLLFCLAVLGFSAYVFAQNEKAVSNEEAGSTDEKFCTAVNGTSCKEESASRKRRSVVRLGYPGSTEYHYRTPSRASRYEYDVYGSPAYARTAYYGSRNPLSLGVLRTAYSANPLGDGVIRSAYYNSANTLGDEVVNSAYYASNTGDAIRTGYYTNGLDGRWTFGNFFNSFTPTRAVRTRDNVYVRNYYRYGSFDDCMSDFRNLGLTEVRTVSAASLENLNHVGLLGGVGLANEHFAGVSQETTVGYYGVMADSDYEVLAVRSGCRLDGFDGLHDCIVISGASHPYTDSIRRFVYVDGVDGYDDVASVHVDEGYRRVPARFVGLRRRIRV